MLKCCWLKALHWGKQSFSVSCLQFVTCKGQAQGQQQTCSTLLFNVANHHYCTQLAASVSSTCYKLTTPNTDCAQYPAYWFWAVHHHLTFSCFLELTIGSGAYVHTCVDVRLASCGRLSDADCLPQVLPDHTVSMFVLVTGFRPS